MGMTIDKTIEFFIGLECHTPQAKDARDVAIDTMRKYQMLQTQYVERLRADMAAMITEIQLDIEELKSYESADGQDLVMLADIGTLFQQKINNLKED